MRYKLKKWINRLLKKFHNFFILFGINISFVKKQNKVNAFNHNSLDGQNEFYNTNINREEIISKSHQDFFYKIIELLEENSIKIDDKIIADFGCGLGNLLYHLSQKYKPKELFGYDFSDKAIAFAKKHFPIATYQQHDIYTKLDIKFDLGFCTEVLEHLNYPERALQNLISGMNPEAHLFLTVPNGRIDTYEGHINFWSPESWNFFIEKNCPIDFTFKTGIIKGDINYAIIKFRN